MARKVRLLSFRRAEKGLWTSADLCQRVLMVIGAFFLLAGCYLLSCNEEFFVLRGEEVAAAEHGFVEYPCHGANVTAPALAHHGSLVHLEDCAVRRQPFSADSPGLSILYAFRQSLPKTIEGAWLRVNLEQYSGRDGEWLAVEEVANLRALEVVSRYVAIGDFPLARDLARGIPGSDVPVLQAADYRPKGRDTAMDARNMQAHNSRLYSGNPQWPEDGDVRVWFTVGDAERASVLAAWSGEHLELWRSPGLRGDFDPLAEKRMLGIVASGAVSADALLSKIEPFSEGDVWPMRCVGLAIIWLGMSLLLFPNHVVPDFCGAYCCCRSLPGAMFTAVIVGGFSFAYFKAPIWASISAACVVSALFAVASGKTLRPFRRQSKSRSTPKQKRGQETPPRLLPTTSTEDVHYVPLSGGVAEQEHPGGGLSNSMRIVLMATGIGIVLAGPVVRALALVDLFGDYYDAFSG